ncbi:MAG: methylaspartate mutase subunit E [Clostridia bacterium]|nr:methylaspartate mutase subunit E [Clostridia bacterium]
METTDKKIPMDQFLETRKEVLAQWPTGAEVDFREAVEYHHGIPVNKRFPECLRKADENGSTLLQPRAGVALVNEHIELLRYLEEHGQADLLPTTIDSYTRHNRYGEAQTGIEESRRENRSLLNGFPAVNHGVAACRKVSESVGIPVQVRHGTPDARLLAEITIAGGFTSFEGGGISYNIPYAKNNPLEKTIRDWQYADRLAGYYAENGVVINREPFGPLTGTLIPPCISHAVAIIESLLAAKQGAGDITVGYGQGGNLTQDVSAMYTLKELTREYLDRFGFNDVRVSTVLHQWMGGFPEDESKAYGVISWGAAAAALSKATKVIVKSPHESQGIPTKEANAAGLRTTRQVIDMLREQRMPMTDEVRTEMEIIGRETRSIIEAILKIGEGDIAAGAIRGFEAGLIDVPFAPSRYNRGKVLPVRDDDGAIRFLDFGQLPFGDDIKAFHNDMVAIRGRNERRKPNFQMVIDDIYAISKGRLVGRPR